MGAFGYSRPATLPHPICFSSRVYSIVQNNSIRRLSQSLRMQDQWGSGGQLSLGPSAGRILVPLSLPLLPGFDEDADLFDQRH
jgi:hypothetical protein